MFASPILNMDLPHTTNSQEAGLQQIYLVSSSIQYYSYGHIAVLLIHSLSGWNESTAVLVAVSNWALTEYIS